MRFGFALVTVYILFSHITKTLFGAENCLLHNLHDDYIIKEPRLLPDYTKGLDELDQTNPLALLREIANDTMELRSALDRFDTCVSSNVDNLVRLACPDASTMVQRRNFWRFFSNFQELIVHTRLFSLSFVEKLNGTKRSLVLTEESCFQLADMLYPVSTTWLASLRCFVERRVLSSSGFELSVFDRSTTVGTVKRRLREFALFLKKYYATALSSDFEARFLCSNAIAMNYKLTRLQYMLYSLVKNDDAACRPLGLPLNSILACMVSATVLVHLHTNEKNHHRHHRYFLKPTKVYEFVKGTFAKYSEFIDTANVSHLQSSDIEALLRTVAKDSDYFSIPPEIIEMLKIKSAQLCEAEYFDRMIHFDPIIKDIDMVIKEVDDIANSASNVPAELTKLIQSQRPPLLDDVEAWEKFIDGDSDKPKGKTRESRTREPKTRKPKTKETKAKETKNQDKNAIATLPPRCRDGPSQRGHLASNRPLNQKTASAVEKERDIDYLLVGEFCFGQVLYPYIQHLGWTTYSWNGIQEQANREIGPIRLGNRDIASGVIKACIQVIKYRLPKAHPQVPDSYQLVEDADNLMTGCSQAKRYISAVLNLVQSTSTLDTTKLFRHRRGNKRQLSPEELTYSALRLGEFCQTKVLEPCREHLNLDRSTKKSVYLERLRNDQTDILGDLGLDYAVVEGCVVVHSIRSFYAHPQKDSDTVFASLVRSFKDKQDIWESLNDLLQ